MSDSTQTTRGGSEFPRSSGEFRAVPLLSRAHSASLAIYLAALLVSLRFDSLQVSLGLTAGTALAMGLLATWQFVVPRAFGPGSKRGKRAAVAIALVKLPVVSAILWLLLSNQLVSGGAFVAGLMAPQLAIGLLALGARVNKVSTQEVAHAAPRA